MQDKRPLNEKGEAHGFWSVTYNDYIGTTICKGHFINGTQIGLWISESVVKDLNVLKVVKELTATEYEFYAT